MANGAKLLLAVLYGTTGDNVQKLHLGRFRLGIKEKKKKSRKITSSTTPEPVIRKVTEISRGSIDYEDPLLI